jgi:hypothetical protein
MFVVCGDVVSNVGGPAGKTGTLARRHAGTQARSQAGKHRTQARRTHRDEQETPGEQSGVPAARGNRQRANGLAQALLGPASLWAAGPGSLAQPGLAWLGCVTGRKERAGGEEGWEEEQEKGD